jgi:hypothetical protein
MVVCSLCFIGCGRGAPRALPRTPPKLVVQITVDQLRADLLPRMLTQLGPHGFRRFLEQGVDYRAASYAHAVTETAVGHTTLFTGALPSDHGIVANDWLDSATGLPRAAVSDPSSSLVTSEGERADAGVSPRALLPTTIGDELRLATEGASLVYAVSSKDRGAILPGGRLGKAFWLDDTAGGMVSSRYYYATLPAWVNEFNAAHPPAALSKLVWSLDENAVHTRAGRDDAASERPPKGLSRRFPHALKDLDPKARMNAFRRTPFSDTLTLDFVRALLEHEPLGRDATPDLLAVSFSATDYVAHAFGPESLEMEDQLLRLDQIIAQLFELLTARVPAEQLLVVLSGDHGGCESPEYLLSRGLAAGRHDMPKLLEKLRSSLTSMYGPGRPLLSEFVNPDLWLDESALRERGLDLRAVEDKLAQLVLAQPGFARAFTAHALRTGSLGDDPIARRVLANFYPGRSGHVHLVPQPGWLLANDEERLASMHGTPHRYDTDVQLSFYGWGLPAQRVLTSVDPRDIAVTLAAILDVKAPSAASGRALDAIVAHATQ